MKSLTFLLLLVSVATFVSCEEDLLKLFAPFIAECAKKNSVKVEDLEAAVFQDDFPDDQLCGIKCVYHKFKVLNDDGTFVDDEFARQIKDLGVEVKDLDKLRECTQKIGKIVSCEDMKKLNECFKIIASREVESK